MTDRPKIDAAEVESVRRWAKRESPSGSWDVRLDRVFDMALQALDTREVRAKELDDAERKLANEPPQGATNDNWWNGFRAALAMLRARAAAIRRGEF